MPCCDEYRGKKEHFKEARMVLFVYSVQVTWCANVILKFNVYDDRLAIIWLFVMVKMHVPAAILILQ